MRRPALLATAAVVLRPAASASTGTSTTAILVRTDTRLPGRGSRPGRSAPGHRAVSHFPAEGSRAGWPDSAQSGGLPVKGRTGCGLCGPCGAGPDRTIIQFWWRAGHGPRASVPGCPGVSTPQKERER